MKFQFTKRPETLKIGDIVNGFTIEQYSHTKKNAIGYRHDSNGRFERVLLIFTDERPIIEHRPVS